MVKPIASRLYSLPEKHVEMLARLALHTEMNPSEYLRQMVEVAFISTFGHERVKRKPFELSD